MKEPEIAAGTSTDDDIEAAIGAVGHVLTEETGALPARLTHYKNSVWGKVCRLEATIGSSVFSALEARHIFLILAVLLALNCSQPAHAWWIFKHHHHEEETSDGKNPSIFSPSSLKDYPPGSDSSQQSQPTERRLLPLPTSNARRLLPLGATTSQPWSREQPSYNQSPKAITPMTLPSTPDALSNSPIYPSRLATTNIRVGLTMAATAADVVTADGAILEEYQTGVKLANLSPATRWSIKLERQRLSFTLKDWSQLSYQSNRGLEHAGSDDNISPLRPVLYRAPEAPRLNSRALDKMSFHVPLGGLTGYKAFAIVPNSIDGQSALFSLNGKPYRGKLVILPQAGNNQATNVSCNLINELDLEDYLRGVVPSEMPSSWPAEAIKAQAIAARSYAYRNIGKHGKDGYDMKDTTDDQVYGGVKAESTSSNQAVDDTRGIIMTYEGNPICAYFHSASGGITESAENVWGKPLPYLQAVVDHDQQSPMSSWNRTFTVDQLESSLAPQLGKLLSIDVVSRSVSHRAQELLLIGSLGSQIVSAETVRKALKLPSTNFNVSILDGAYCFSGHGFGHGLGLSQWGAKSLAEQGYNAAQILTYYYRNVSLERLNDVTTR
jgi:stage II sporulation protein D